jgi:hypothetical protein
MWNCPECGESLEDQFDSCWRCAGKAVIISQDNTNKHRLRVISYIVIGVVVLGLTIYVLIPGMYKFYSHTVYKSSSPAEFGEACFFQESDAFVSTIDLYVKDYSKSRFELIRVGTVSGFETGPPPGKAIWSQDGTVVAVVKGHASDNEEKISWTHAYDFKTHRIYGDAGNYNFGEIHKLLDSRGGEGHIILANKESYKSLARPYYPWELFPLCEFP